MRKTIRYTLIALAALLMAGQPVLARGASSDLKARVVDELARYYFDSHFDITVPTPGDVVIKGTVTSFWDRRKIFDIVARVPGVREISDRLVVETEIVPDAMIRAKIQSELVLNDMILEPDKIQVSVTRGTVVLGGTVSFYREAAAAEDIAAWPHGVKGVVNEIKVLPLSKAITDQNLNALLRDVIDRFFPLEKTTVQVSVKAGWATLSGTVTSLWARRSIAKEVWHVNGVTGVQNNIDVKPVD